MRNLPLPKHPHFDQFVRDHWLAGVIARDIVRQYDPPFRDDMRLASRVVCICAYLDSCAEGAQVLGKMRNWGHKNG